MDIHRCINARDNVTGGLVGISCGGMVDLPLAAEGKMIEMGLPSEDLEIEPFCCGAYFEVSATREDADGIEEIREQLFAKMMGWA